MPWTSLEDRVAELPLIIAGPILRRVEPNSVSVWVALSKARNVGLHIISGIVDTGSGENVFDNSDAIYTANKASIRIGEHLHLALVTLVISGSDPALTPQHLYSYNLTFSGGLAPEDLKSLQLLKDKTTAPKHLAIGYQERLLPTFVTPPNALDKINIFHTSCRKAHGFGNEDALKGIDILIKKAGIDPLKRPHQLFLTGDQIYADDVAMTLLPMLTDAGNILLGIKEIMTDNTSDGIEVNIHNLPTGRRLKTSFKTANFSSTDARSHAFSFGEYCALYLFYWSNVLWTKDLPEADAFLTEPNPLPEKPDLLSKLPTGDDLEELKEEFKAEKKRLEVFIKALPNVRRLLANVPVYMMFDDHEVTDDWNITEQWRKDVLAAPFGKMVLRNGLVGFALFQAWGNMPQYYEGGIGAEILEKASALFPATATEGPDKPAGDRLDAIFGFNDTGPEVKWHYTVKSGATITAVLDSRTHRLLKGKYAPPGLINKASLLEQLPEELIPSAGAEVLLIVATAPVLGLGIFEELIQPFMATATNFMNRFKTPKDDEKLIHGYEEVDMEAWGLNPQNFEQFLAHLYPFKKIVFLSGDVHFGFTTKLEYWKKNDSKTSQFVQLVASAAKNEIDSWKRMMLPNATSQKIFSQAYFPMERKGWNNATGLIDKVSVPDGQIIPYNMRVRLKNSPVLLPTTGWPAGTVFNEPSDWSWRLEFVKDERLDADRPAKARLPFGDTDIDPANAAEGYVKVLKRHEKFFDNNFSRRINWNANIGKVTFSGTGTTLKVKHELFFFHPKDPQPNDPQPYMEYEVDFNPSENSQPVIPRSL
jgi:hypothetical protein